MLNIVILSGNVGRDAEIRHTQSGKAIASFTVATDSGYKDKATGEWVSKPQWHNIVVLNDALTKAAQERVKKGVYIEVTGSLEYEKYTDKDGKEKQKTVVKIGQYNGNFTVREQRTAPSHDAQQHAVNAPVVAQATIDEEIPS